MKDSFLIKLTVTAGGLGLLLLAASMIPRTAPEPELSPYVSLMMEGVRAGGPNKAYFQEKIDKYYAAPLEVQAMRDGLIRSGKRHSEEMAIRRAEAKDEAQAAMVEFCEDRPRRCQ